LNDLRLSSEKTNLELRIIHQVSDEAEAFYPMSVELGDHAAYALQKAHRSQIIGLENIAESALKATDIFDYIKQRIARYEYWRRPFPGHCDEAFGLRLKNYLEYDLAVRRDRICVSDRLAIGSESVLDKHLRRRVYLMLIRQCVHYLTVQYEFRVSLLSEERRG
jgi:hypothetical protein